MPAACFAVGVIPHLIVCYVLIYNYKMGILGAGIAVIVSNTCIYLMIYLIMKYHYTDISPEATQFKLEKKIYEGESLK